MTRNEMNQMFASEKARIAKNEAKREAAKKAPAKQAHIDMINMMNKYRAAK